MISTSSPAKRLTDEQRQQYLDQGFVLVRGLLSACELEPYKTRAREFALGKIPPGADKMVVKDVRVAKGLVKPEDPEKGLWKYLNPDKYDPLFAAYPSQPAIVDIVEDLIGPDIKAFLVMFIYKPPMLDSVHPYHQDAYYFMFEPHDYCVGTWLPLDPVDTTNGTIHVIPGSHKWGLLPHSEQGGKAKIFGVEGYDDRADELTFEVNPGDCLFFHSRLLHKTGSNLSSDRHRRVMTVHFASSRCRPAGENPYEPIQFRLVRGSSYEGCI